MIEPREVSKQMLIDIGINAWAVELLIESYNNMGEKLRNKILEDGVLTFCFRSHKTPLLQVTIQPVKES